MGINGMADQAQRVCRKTYGKEKIPVVKSGWDKCSCLQQVAIPHCTFPWQREFLRTSDCQWISVVSRIKHTISPSLALESSVH